MSNLTLNLEGLQRLEQNLTSLRGRQQIPAPELFHSDFMRRCSSFASFDEMVDKSHFTVESAEDFEAIPESDWDSYVRATTTFPSWEAMLQQATVEWIQKRLAG
jgi:hypothetical protein